MIGHRVDDNGVGVFERPVAHTQQKLIQAAPPSWEQNSSNLVVMWMQKNVSKVIGSKVKKMCYLILFIIDVLKDVKTRVINNG